MIVQHTEREIDQWLFKGVAPITGNWNNHLCNQHDCPGCSNNLHTTHMKHVFRRYTVWILVTALNNHFTVHVSPSLRTLMMPDPHTIQSTTCSHPPTPFNCNNLSRWEVLLSNLRTIQMLMKQRHSLHTTVHGLQQLISHWTLQPSCNIYTHFCLIFNKYTVKITAQKPANLTKVWGGISQSLRANVNSPAGSRQSWTPVLRVYDLSWQSTLIPLFWPYMTLSNKLGQDNTASQSAPPTLSSDMFRLHQVRFIIFMNEILLHSIK